MRRSLVLLLGIVVLVSGCDVIGDSPNSSGTLRIQTARDTYSNSQIVAVHLDNRRSATIIYDDCATVLQRKTDNGWDVYDAMICTPNVAARDVRIDAGKVISDSLIWFNGNEEPGMYRLKFSVTNSKGELLPKHERLTGEITLER